jgi:hypothetical protein
LDHRESKIYIYNDGHIPKPRGVKNYKPIKYEVSESGCWNCISHALSKHRGGYPVLERNGRFYRMSRYVYEKEHGYIDDQKFVMHLCDNPSCINPDHLILGTPRENTQDMIRKNRKPVGEDASVAKLNEEQVVSIFNDNRKCSVIAKDYGVSKKTVFNIWHGRTWKHLGLVSEVRNDNGRM